MQAWRARVSWARVCLCMWWNGKEARKGSWNKTGQSRLAIVKRPGLNQFFRDHACSTDFWCFRVQQIYTAISMNSILDFPMFRSPHPTQ